MARPDFLESLVEDLRPVIPAPRWSRACLVSSGLGWAAVSGLVLISGPLREGAVAALSSVPRYGLEFALGTLTGIASSAAALEWGVPGRPATLRLVLPVVGLLAAWVGSMVLSVFSPTIETGMLGKRGHCALEILVFSLPPLVLILCAMSRRAVSIDAFAVVFAGIGAGSFPAVWMQLACMHDPIHGLAFHLAPIAFLAVGGALGIHAQKSAFPLSERLLPISDHRGRRRSARPTNRRLDERPRP